MSYFAFYVSMLRAALYKFTIAFRSVKSEFWSSHNLMNSQSFVFIIHPTISPYWSSQCRGRLNSATGSKDNSAILFYFMEWNSVSKNLMKIMWGQCKPCTPQMWHHFHRLEAQSWVQRLAVSISHQVKKHLSYADLPNQDFLQDWWIYLLKKRKKTVNGGIIFQTGPLFELYHWPLPTDWSSVLITRVASTLGHLHISWEICR